METQGLTPEQHLTRRAGLGGSDVGALMGLDRYKTPFDVWLDKTGRSTPRPETQYTRWGHRLESVIADEYRERLKVGLMRCQTVVHKRRPWQLGTPDRLAFTGDEMPRNVEARACGGSLAEVVDWGLEIKNRGSRMAWLWGPEHEGAAGVPDDVAMQCHWYMSLTELPRWDVAVLLDGNDCRVYQLRADAELEAAMLEVAERFWRDHVLADRPPALDGSGAAWQYLATRFRGMDKKTIEAPPAADDLAAEIESAKAQLEEAKERGQRARQLLADLAAGLGATTLKGDDWRFTIVEQRGKPVWKTIAVVLQQRYGVPAVELAEITEACRGKSFTSPRFTSARLKEEDE